MESYNRNKALFTTIVALVGVVVLIIGIYAVSATVPRDALSNAVDSVMNINVNENNADTTNTTESYSNNEVDINGGFDTTRTVTNSDEAMNYPFLMPIRKGAPSYAFRLVNPQINYPIWDYV